MSTYSPVFLSAYTIVAWLESVLCLNLRNHLRFFIMRANAQVVQQQRVDFAKWKEDTMFCSIDETKRNAVITMLITGKPFGKPEFFFGKQYILPSSAWICGVTYVGSHIRKFHVVFGACVSHQSTVFRNKTVIHCDFFIEDIVVSVVVASTASTASLLPKNVFTFDIVLTFVCILWMQQ